MDFLSSAIFQALIGLALSVIIGSLYSIWSKINELYKWHDVKDQEGVRVWYSKNKHMEEILEKMADTIERMDRREERQMLIQNHQIETIEKHNQAINQLIAVIEALTKVVLK